MVPTKLAQLSILVAGLSVFPACNSSPDGGALGDVKSLVFLQRPKRNEIGDIFQYRSYRPGARIVELSPPTADGELRVLCCDGIPGFEQIDISNYDLSFDATQIVFSGKLSEGQKYGLFLLTLADGKVEQLATNFGKDYVSPIFLPGNKILFTTNAVVEENAPQHVDEYERSETLQLGTINVDGTNEVLGPRHLSHRVHPTLLSDGRVMTTQWEHLGPMNAGFLTIVNPDMTTLREGFGKENTGITNSYLKAREIAPGRVIAIGTARDRTIQAGTLIDIRLGKPSSKDGVVRADTEASEANASYKIYSPNVPLGREPSASTIGRYYDAFPLNAKEDPDLLVSWADGTVEAETLAKGGVSANFGIYLYDTKSQTRKPIWDDPEMWDVFARPLQSRPAPPEIPAAAPNGIDSGALLIGSMNVYESSLATFEPGSIYGVRVMEGFSSEEGFPRTFGNTMFEGHAQLGISKVQNDKSWLALVPPNVPIHLQAIDKFGMSLVNEPVWFSGRPGEARVCEGCHGSRSKAHIINPGITEAFAVGPTPMMAATPRNQRLSNTFTRDAIIGVPWDRALQGIFDQKCVSCHDGQPSAANPSYTITDPMTGESATWVFDLRGQAVDITVGNLMIEGLSASYLSLVGPDPEAIERAKVMITGDFKVYMRATDARGSEVIKKLNPVQQFPEQNPAVRAFSTPPHSSVGYAELSPDEFYRMVLAADMGANFYARENNPDPQAYQ
ncbi:MAG: hypothetical protein R3B48_06755 [Kofleriaceae bacterium]